MKQLLTVFIAVILFSCGNKQAEQPSASETKVEIPVAKVEKMKASELKAWYGIELPGLDYSAGTETARGKKVKSDAVTLTVVTDLVLTNSGGVFTTTLSPNAEWGGVQNFVIQTSNDGAVSVCNWNWSNTTAPATQTCTSSTTGNYRSWTSDKITYDVHLSNWVVQ